MSLKEFLFGFSTTTKQRHPHLFIHHNIDRHNSVRVLPMEVLSLGLGRTGTSSLKHALEILGYPTAHGFDMHSNPQDCCMWNSAFASKRHGISLDSTFWDQLLGHVSAVTDLPCNCFAPDLIASYPAAKVILVERDIEKWYPSFERAVISGTDHPFLLRLFSLLDPQMSGPVKVLLDGVMRGQFHAQNSSEFRANARQVYREHYTEIRAILKDQPERLLEFKLEEGWEPLCEFLGKEVPPEGVAFPRVNESKMHDEMLRVTYLMILQRCMRTVGLWLMPVVLAWGVWRYLCVSR